MSYKSTPWLFNLPSCLCVLKSLNTYIVQWKVEPVPRQIFLSCFRGSVGDSSCYQLGQLALHQQPDPGSSCRWQANYRPGTDLQELLKRKRKPPSLPSVNDSVVIQIASLPETRKTSSGYEAPDIKALSAHLTP